MDDLLTESEPAVQREAIALESEARITLTRAALAALPDELREELGSAVVALDVKRVSAVADKVAQYDRELAAALADHANTYSFTAIRTALQ